MAPGGGDAKRTGHRAAAVRIICDAAGAVERNGNDHMGTKFGEMDREVASTDRIGFRFVASAHKPRLYDWQQMWKFDAERVTKIRKSRISSVSSGVMPDSIFKILELALKAIGTRLFR